MRHGKLCALAILGLACLLFFEQSSAVAAADEQEKTNIVLLLADDLGYGDLACFGAPDVKTPNLDRLAADGARFTQHYSNGPECSSTRTALLTGRYQQRVGGLECAIGTGNVGRYDDAIRLAGEHDLGLPVKAAVLPTAIKNAGYATAIYGKWHLGYETKFNPLEYGFDHFFGCLGGNVDYFTHAELSPLPVLYEDRKPIRRDGYMTHQIADNAVRFINRHRAEPFFLYVPFTAPHFPFQAPGDEDVPFDESNWTQGTRAKYVELIDDMDEQSGLILDALQQAGLAERTLVVFASDNGAMAPGRNLPLSNFKGTLYEGGIRVPLIIRWPGKVAAATVSHQVCATMDLTASLVRIATGQPVQQSQFDGMDIVTHVTSGQADRQRTLYWRARRGERTERAVRHGDLKYLHRRLDDGEIVEGLFDLSADPAESTNLIRQRVADAERLRSLLSGWEDVVRPTR